MNDDVHFIEPLHLVSPKFDVDYCRLHELLGAPPADIRSLEQGLWTMCSKLIELSELLFKSFVLADENKFNRSKALAEEIHSQEKTLTAHLVHLPSTSPAVLKALVLFPGRLERVGDLLESVLNVSMIKARTGTPFTDKAVSELKELFGLFAEMLKILRDVISTCDKPALEHLAALNSHIAQMTLDFADAHGIRLMKGLCSPRASSLYLDVLDSVRNANRHIRDMADALTRIASSAEMIKELRSVE